ncbi:DUF805 domain-containing protein [Lichenibacterium minor]|uniref:DUF805 domain-containing protein n=1 Tax=Lichenibacterium minor TaxID=2316528 RepID=A0A4Q2U290_9HYPH|nr:DUF805 domain-containing protein [Lichenibacterium minor]RYC28795.1 DUF805 domain-containing protein [Lichenibacterium minor]
MAHPLNDPADESNLNRGWFYHRAGTDHGPMDREALAEILRLMPLVGILVWHSSLPDWASATEAPVRALIYGPPPAPDSPSGLVSLLFSFEGRLGRARFFWASCLSIVPYILVVMAVVSHMHVPVSEVTGTLIRLALALPFVWIGLALTAKRLHDLDLSGFHLLWVAPLAFGSAFLPPGLVSLASMVLSGVVEIWLLTKRGTYGRNDYGPDPLPIAKDYVIHRKTKKAGSLNVWTLASLLTLVSVGAFLTYGGRALESVRPAQSLCSNPGVLVTLGDLIKKDPTWIIIGAYYGSFSNARISFHSIRTLEEGSPVRGSTCAAMMNVSAIDKSKVGIADDRDLSDFEYTVQYIDGSSTEYVVNVVH